MTILSLTNDKTFFDFLKNEEMYKKKKNERSAYALKYHDPQFKISNMNLFQENDLIIDNFFSFLNAFYLNKKDTK